MKKFFKKYGQRLIWTTIAIFSQIILIEIVSVVALLAIIYGFTMLGDFWWILGVVIVLIILSVSNLIALIRINHTDIDASFKYSWAVFVVMLPLAGPILYFRFHRKRPLSIWKNITLNPLEFENKYNAENHQKTHESLQNANDLAYRQTTYIENHGYGVLYNTTKTTYLKEGIENFEMMLKKIKEAKKYIFMEYFILARGTMWDELREALLEKVKEGVDVRLIYDDTGSISRVPTHYDKKLTKMGIKTKRFNPLKPILTNDNINTRNHRKLCVIDGTTVFTGGINIGDEYINRINRFGYWKDTGIMMEGPAAMNFVVLFISMWNALNKTHEKIEDFFPDEMVSYENSGYVQTYCDFPADAEMIGENVFLHLIAMAKKSVHIMTPYLVITDRLKGALISAAKQGIEVSIIMPGIPDKIVPYEIAQSYWPSLVNAGVHIHIFEPGFIHAKSCVVDEDYGTIGTVNLDYRSLFFHIECGVWMYKTESLKAIESDFQETLTKCRELKTEDVKYSVWKKIKLAILKFVLTLM